jgi:fucose permease
MTAPSQPATLDPIEVRRARTAVSVVFAGMGIVISSWMSRIPAVRDSLDMSPGEIGRVLLALAVGSLIAMPTAGVVVGRIGAARTVALGSVVTSSGLVVAGLGGDTWAMPAIASLGLAVLGYGSGSWDVAMNVEGAEVERALGRTIMPRFHAAFSLGTVAGAGIGAAATAIGVTVTAHLVVIGLVVAVATVTAARAFLPRHTTSDGEDSPTTHPSVWAAWREPRTLLIGVTVLSFALIEGVANDWLALGLVDGYGVSNATGAAGLAVFVAAMTLGRLAGTRALDRYGRVPVVRATAALAAAGVLLVVLGGSLVVAYAGIVLWGFGASLGFPLGMSAAADDPRRAAARVSVTASIGYTAFLAGPPLVGWLGDHHGILDSLLVIVAAAVVGALVGPAVRERRNRRG